MQKLGTVEPQQICNSAPSAERGCNEMSDLKKAPSVFTVKAGFVYHDRIGKIRVMAVAENYAMCRRPGAIPFVKSIAEVILDATTEFLKNQAGSGVS